MHHSLNLLLDLILRRHRCRECGLVLRDRAFALCMECETKVVTAQRAPAMKVTRW